MRLMILILLAPLLACSLAALAACDGSGSASAEDASSASGADASSIDGQAPPDDAADWSETPVPDAGAPDGAGSDVAPDRQLPPDTGEPVPVKDPGLVQWVHLLEGSVALDIAVGDVTVVGALGYANGTAPIVTPAGAAAWTEWGGGAVALWSDVPPAGAPATLIACGTVADPQLVTVPAQEPPSPNLARIRIVHAVAGAGAIEGTLRSNVTVIPLGAPEFGQRGPSVDVDDQGPWELTLVRDGGAVVLPLPALAPGHAVDAIVAPGGPELFVLLLQDDGQTRQAGIAEHVSRWRFANLTSLDLSAVVSDQDTPGLQAISPLKASPIHTFAPGTKHVDITAQGAGVVATLPALPLPVGKETTTVLYTAADGQVGAVTVDTSSGPAGGAGSVQVVHAASDLGAVDIAFTSTLEPWSSGPKPIVVGDGASLGQVTQPATLPKGSYTLGIDQDGDGKSELTWDVGYYLESTEVWMLTRDPDGNLCAGRLMTAGGGIWWQMPREELAEVRVVNLTTAPQVIVDVPTWHEVDGPTTVGSQQSTYAIRVLQGTVTIEISPLLTDESWSWTGELVAKHGYTVVFWEDGGEVHSLLTDDTVYGDVGVRLVNLATSLGAVQGSWSPVPSGAEVGVGPVSPGEAGAVTKGGFSAQSPGQLGLDLDGDGQDDTTFVLSDVAYQKYTNLYLRADADWPFLLVQGDTNLNAVYAEELQARLRVVYLDGTTGALFTYVDGASVGWGESVKSANGTGVSAQYAVGPFLTLTAGQHTVKVTDGTEEGSLEVDLAGGTRHTLLARNVGGALALELLDDDAAPPGSSVTAVHAAASAGPVTIWSMGQAPAVFAGPLAFGEQWDVPLGDALPASFGIDWDADGSPDWKSDHGATVGHTWLFVTGTDAQSGLLPVGPGTSTWMGGGLLP